MKTSDKITNIRHLGVIVQTSSACRESAAYSAAE